MPEKENVSRLRAADFARICGTNKRTLHHYDQIGLFAPALRGENGYRYYSQEQYDVFMVIAALKELGMPLLDIKAYLDRRDPERLSALLDQQEIVRQAQQKAAELLSAAQQQSREMRTTITDYCENMLRQTEEILARSAGEVKNVRGALRQKAKNGG